MANNINIVIKDSFNSTQLLKRKTKKTDQTITINEKIKIAASHRTSKPH